MGGAELPLNSLGMALVPLVLKIVLVLIVFGGCAALCTWFAMSPGTAIACEGGPAKLLNHKRITVRRKYSQERLAGFAALWEGFTTDEATTKLNKAGKLQLNMNAKVSAYGKRCTKLPPIIANTRNCPSPPLQSVSV